MTHSTTSNRALLPLALFGLAGLLFFVGLGDMGLTDRDEGRNAEAGREMFETGDRLTPTFNYELRVAKPVFLYWLMDYSYRLFGVNEFAARFPSALFGVALIVLQFFFVSRVKDRTIGLFGALMLLLNLEILGLGRMALTDSVLIFFTTASLYGFWMGLHGTEGERKWMWAFYVGMAVATLTKGPVGLVVPLLTAVLYLTWTRRWRDYWQHGSPLSGTLLLILLAVPWYAAMFLIHGDAYASGAKAHTIGRFFGSMEGHGFTIFFYIPVLLLGFFPWSGLLPVTLYRTLKDWYQLRRSALLPNLSHTSELELFAALWVVGVFIFFTASSTRLPHYIGPIFPAASILTACFWSKCLTDPTTPGIRTAIHLTMGLGYVLAIAFASLPTLYTKISSKMIREFPLAGQIDLGIEPYVIAAVLLIGMTLVGYFGLNDERRSHAFWAAGATFASMMLIVIVVAIPRLNQYFIAPPQVLAYTAGVNLGPGDQLIAYGMTRPSTVFYAGRKVIYIEDYDEQAMRASLAQPRRTMILLPETFLSRLPAETRNYQPILTRFGYVLLSNEAMVKMPEGTPVPAPPPIRGHGQ